MRKILVISSLFVMFMFLVSCAPQLTDEELEAELAKLTPEEREELLKELESKESGALAGQATKVSAKYGATIARASRTKIQATLEKQISLVCTDSDGGKDYYKSGFTTNKNLPINSDKVNQDHCILRMKVSDKDGNFGASEFFINGEHMDCDKYGVGDSFFYDNPSPFSEASGNVEVISIEGCKLQEAFCLDSISNRSETIDCPHGCKAGACLPA